MTVVSRFESDLLRILHALLGRAPIDGVLGVLSGRQPRPACLSAGAVRLVEDALAKGCVHAIARMGGWLPARHLRGDRVASGRLWERDRPESLGLSFSGRTLEYLIWLTAAHPGDSEGTWDPPEASLSDGDRVFLFLAREVLRELSIGEAIDARPAVRANGLIRLAHPDEFPDTSSEPPNFGPWTSGPSAAVVEALQPWLARRWAAVERRKARIGQPSAMRALAASMDRVLGGWLGACEASGRRDLARFLVAAGAAVLGDAPTARGWIGGLDLKGLRVSDRAEVYRAAGSFLRAFERLRLWEREARAIGFLDDGYAAGQLWKSDWEALGGEAAAERAAAVLRALDPLNVAGPAPA